MIDEKFLDLLLEELLFLYPNKTDLMKELIRLSRLGIALERSAYKAQDCESEEEKDPISGLPKSMFYEC